MKELASSPSTKTLIMPTEITKALGAIEIIMDQVNSSKFEAKKSVSSNFMKNNDLSSNSPYTKNAPQLNNQPNQHPPNQYSQSNNNAENNKPFNPFN